MSLPLSPAPRSVFRDSAPEGMAHRKRGVYFLEQFVVEERGEGSFQIFGFFWRLGTFAKRPHHIASSPDRRRCGSQLTRDATRPSRPQSFRVNRTVVRGALTVKPPTLPTTRGLHRKKRRAVQQTFFFLESIWICVVRDGGRRGGGARRRARGTPLEPRRGGAAQVENAAEPRACNRLFSTLGEP